MNVPTQLFINNQVRHSCYHFLSACSLLTLTKYVNACNDGKVICLARPYDEKVAVENVQVARTKDINKAVSAATEAYRNGPWSTFTPAQRQTSLLRFAELVENHAERLAYLESLPTGRPVTPIKQFDLAHMVQVFRCKLYFFFNIFLHYFRRLQVTAKWHGPSRTHMNACRTMPDGSTRSEESLFQTTMVFTKSSGMSP